MPPEKRAKLLEDFQRIMDQQDLFSDLQSGKCARSAEVQIKAGQGDPDSVYMLSEMYRMGWCVAQNVSLFHDNLEKAAKLGKTSAAFDIGHYYETGTEGYPKAADLAVQWYQTAIAAGEARAMVSLGSLLLGGKEVPKNTKSALQLLSRAADMDEENLDASNRALGQLAIYYMRGEDAPQNFKVSRTYSLRGAAQCDAASMALVALSFENQNPPDFGRAYAWASAATQHSDGKALEFANRVKDQLAQKIDANARSAAELLARKLPICLPLEARKRSTSNEPKGR
jgi:TPR repeat protein